MADEQFKSSLDDDRGKGEGRANAVRPNAAEDLSPANEERSLDIGESGQFAPGGRYNELGVTAPRRLDLDEQVNSALDAEKKQ